MTDEVARADNDGLENTDRIAGMETAGLENEGREHDGGKMPDTHLTDGK